MAGGAFLQGDNQFKNNSSIVKLASCETSSLCFVGSNLECPANQDGPPRKPFRSHLMAIPFRSLRARLSQCRWCTPEMSAGSREKPSCNPIPDCDKAMANTAQTQTTMEVQPPRVRFGLRTFPHAYKGWLQTSPAASHKGLCNLLPTALHVDGKNHLLKAQNEQANKSLSFWLP